MCGQFTLRASPGLVEEAIGLFAGLDDFKPRFNIAPTQSILVLHHREGEEKPRYAGMRWGPCSFLGRRRFDRQQAPQRSLGWRGGQASFRSAYKRRRCLVIADGFYEWKATAARRSSRTTCGAWMIG